MSLKVLFVVQEGPDSGITVYSKSVAEELRKRGFTVNIDEKYNEKYDLIHIHGRPHIGIIQNIIQKMNVPIVTTTHMTTKELDGLIPKPLIWVAEYYLFGLHKVCSKIFVTAPSIMRELNKKKKFRKKLVYLGYSVNLERFIDKKVDKNEFKKKYKLDPKRKMILCVASIQKRKGFFDFIETAKKLPQYDFVWIGKIPQTPYLEKKEELVKTVKETKPKNVYCPGTMFGEELVKAFYSSDLFFLPSYAETFGLVIIEAGAAKKQILVRDLPVYNQFKKFVQTYKKHPEEKIVEILENQKKYPFENNKARKEIQKFFIKEHVDGLVREYKKLIKQKKNERRNQMKILHQQLERLKKYKKKMHHYKKKMKKYHKKIKMISKKFQKDNQLYFK